MSLLELPNGDYVDPEAVVTVYVKEGGRGLDGWVVLGLANGGTITVLHTEYAHQALPKRDRIAALINDALPRPRRVPPLPADPAPLSADPGDTP